MVKSHPARQGSDALNTGSSGKVVELTPASKAEVDSEDTPPIIGIGASAGGLEALEQFLSHVPANSGTAFVVIQHLDPTNTTGIQLILFRKKY